LARDYVVKYILAVLLDDDYLLPKMGRHKSHRCVPKNVAEELMKEIENSNK